MKIAAWLGAVLLGLTIATTALGGEPSAADRESARALLQEGDKSTAAGNHAAALKSYEAAHALLNLPATGMAVARTKVELGQLVQARESALAIAKIPKPAGAEKPANVEARAAAVKLAEELAARIPSIAVEVKAPAEAKPSIEIDGVVLPTGSTTEKVNPGRRKIRVVAKGFRDFEQIIEVKERETKKVPVVLEAGEGSTPPVPPEPQATGDKPAGGQPAGGTSQPDKGPASGGSTSLPNEDGPSPLLISGIVVGGVGVVGVAIGAAFGVLTMNDLNDAEEDPALCPNKQCTAEGRETVDGGRTKGIVSTVGFAVGGAALATGVVLVVLGVTSGPSDAETTAVRIAPGPGDVGTGIAIGF